MALAAMLVVSVAGAQAGPVGNQYVPQVPKAGSKQHESSGSSSGGTTSSPGYTSTASGSTSTGSSRPAKPKPLKPQHEKTPKSVKVTPTSSGGGGSTASGGSAWIPIAIIVIAGAITAAVGITLRRRTA